MAAALAIGRLARHACVNVETVSYGCPVTSYPSASRSHCERCMRPVCRSTS